MKKAIVKSLLMLAVLVQAAVILAAGNNHGLSKGMQNPGYQEKPKWFKLSFLDIREDVAEAKAAKKRVMLYFYQDGCPYCAKLLNDNFGQRRIALKTQKYFDVIAINMWGDREVTDFNGKETTEKKFAQQMRVMFTPTLLVLNEQGKVILRINGYWFPAKFSAMLDWAGKHKESEISFRGYFARLSPTRASGKLHQEKTFLKPPYNLTASSRASGKPLLVMFEQPHCKACDELHTDILKRKASRQWMKKFDIVLLHMWSRAPVVTPDGKKTSVRQWAAKLNITNSPSLVFFDDKGKVVFRAEAYLKAFHVQGSMSYVATGAYRTQPSFQRYLQKVNAGMTKKGIKVDLMK
jgi:thioredoxin-related protein